jgi:hypothetical protein
MITTALELINEGARIALLVVITLMFLVAFATPLTLAIYLSFYA